MILKKNLEWSHSSSGHRVAKLPQTPTLEKRLVLFSELTGQEGLKSGAHHFSNGDFAFYNPGFLEEIEADDGVQFSAAAVLYDAEEKAEDATAHRFNFLPLSVNYEVRYQEEAALIKTVIEFFAFEKASAIANLKVDGYELLPSARINIERGMTIVELKEVKLVRPKKLWHSNRNEETLYIMELELGAGGSNTLKDSKELRVWGVS